MVTPRPSLLRTIATILSTLFFALFCASCSPSPRETLSGTNGIRVQYANQGVIGGYDGYWRPSENTILLSYGCPDWVLAHEIAHATDTYGGDFRLVLRMVGNPTTLTKQTALAHRVADLAATFPSHPRPYWQALLIICGRESVADHPEILATLSLPSTFTAKARK